MKWILGGAGLLAGIAFGVSVMIRAITQFPSGLGFAELAFFLVIVGFLGIVTGAVGFGVGCIVDLFRKKG